MLKMQEGGGENEGELTSSLTSFPGRLPLPGDEGHPLLGGGRVGGGGAAPQEKAKPVLHANFGWAVLLGDAAGFDAEADRAALPVHPDPGVGRCAVTQGDVGHAGEVEQPAKNGGQNQQEEYYNEGQIPIKVLLEFIGVVFGGHR